MSDVTRILSQIEQGDPLAAEKLLPLVYDELRRLAGRQLALERTNHTLNPTALVHEAYLRLVDANANVAHWNSRGHFFAAAAESMRRILVDSARKKRAIKRGGAAIRLPLEEANVPAPESPDDLLALDQALTRLEQEHPSLAELVKLRYFAGLTMPQAAEALGISLRTAGRNWTYAKAWLLRAMTAVA
jgi:RNA polymerase sigma factor (TIGR02999 family)